MRKRLIFGAIAGLLVIMVIGAALITAKLPEGQTAAAGKCAAGGAAVGYAPGALGLGESRSSLIAADRAQEGAPYPVPLPPIMPPEPDGSGGQTAAETEQKIIKNGSLRVIVTDVYRTIEEMTGLASRLGGFVQQADTSERADGTHTGYIPVRVPAAKFEEAMAAARDLALAVKDQSSSGQDVTERYTDLQAQLKNAQAQEATYLEILKMAKTVEDVLKVQQRLGDIRGQIESLQGRLKYLENLTSFSTITVSLEEEPKVTLPSKEFRPASAVKAAAQSLVEVFQSVAIALIWLGIVGGGVFLPLALLGLLVWLVWRRFRR